MPNRKICTPAVGGSAFGAGAATSCSSVTVAGTTSTLLTVAGASKAGAIGTGIYYGAISGGVCGVVGGIAGYALCKMGVFSSCIGTDDEYDSDEETVGYRDDYGTCHTK